MGVEVLRSVDLDGEAMLGALEVDDEALNDLLSAKLQAADLPSSEEVPGECLGGGRCGPHLLSAGGLLGRHLGALHHGSAFPSPGCRTHLFK